MKKVIIPSIISISLLLSYFIIISGCGGGSSTSSGTVPIVVVTATPVSITSNIDIGYISDGKVDWNATSTSDMGSAVFYGLIPGEKYTIYTSTGSTLSDAIAQAGALTGYLVFKDPTWTSISNSGYTEISGIVLETDNVTLVTNGNVKIISESTGAGLSTSINSQGKFSFSNRVPVGFYTIITTANNYITNITYHYPFRTDKLNYIENLVRKDLWDFYAGSSHPYDPNKGYISVGMRDNVAQQKRISGVSMSIQANHPVVPTSTNAPVIINPTATSIPTSTANIKYGNISGRVYTSTGAEFAEAFVVFQSLTVSEKIESSGAFTRTTTAKADGSYIFTNVPHGAGIISFWAYQYNYENYPNNPLGSVFVTVTDNTNGVILQQQNGIGPTQTSTPYNSVPTPTPSTGSNVTVQ